MIKRIFGLNIVFIISSHSIVVLCTQTPYSVFTSGSHINYTASMLGLAAAAAVSQ